MRIISTRMHGVLDYMMSLLVMSAPWLFSFARGGAETWVPVIIGATSLVYTILTNYELGIAKQLSMRTHLTLDFIGGTLLALSPWLFGFSELVYLPHLIFGILEVGTAMITDPVPLTEHHGRRMDERRHHAAH